MDLWNISCKMSEFAVFFQNKELASYMLATCKNCMQGRHGIFELLFKIGTCKRNFGFKKGEQKLSKPF